MRRIGDGAPCGGGFKSQSQNPRHCPHGRFRPNWVERVNEPLGEKELAVVPRCAQRGSPLGDKRSVESTARRLHSCSRASNKGAERLPGRTGLGASPFPTRDIDSANRQKPKTGSDPNSPVPRRRNGELQLCAASHLALRRYSELQSP